MSWSKKTTDRKVVPDFHHFLDPYDGSFHGSAHMLSARMSRVDLSRQGNWTTPRLGHGGQPMEKGRMLGRTCRAMSHGNKRRRGVPYECEYW